MNKQNPKTAMLLSAAIATVAWTAVIVLLDYSQHREIDVPGVVTGAVVFFVVYLLVSFAFMKRKGKKAEDARKTEDNRQA